MGSSSPIATYRLQLRPGFGFAEAAGVVPYLSRLGVSHLYLSPCFEAVPGSEHGYDVTDTSEFRAELGGQEGFERLAAIASEHGLQIILDIVPNHMAASHHNRRWYDVMHRGEQSEYAAHFDIDWQSGLDNKLVLPMLGAKLDDVLPNGEISVIDGERGLEFTYYDNRFPLCAESYPALAEKIEESGQELPVALADQVARLRDRLVAQQSDHAAPRRSESDQLSLEMRSIAADLAAAGALEQASLDAETLRSLLDMQHYRLMFWKTGLEQLNYRRFFDISGLVGVRVEDEAVFDDLHQKLLDEIAAGRIHGLRLDHIDGLRDPATYLRLLRDSVNAAVPKDNASPLIYVEKILAPGEDVPGEWPVSGTTGYEAANAINGVFVDRDGLASLTALRRELTGDTATYEEVEHAARLHVMETSFQPELRRLAALLAELASEADEKVTDEDCAAAIRSVTSHFAVYRVYASGECISREDRGCAERAFEAAQRDVDQASERTALDFMRRLVTGEAPRVSPEKSEDFLRRWQQFSSPVAGKGVEDTAFYRYIALASLNEVGGDPSGEQASVENFHDFNAGRAKASIRSLNTTSTHDTKRSEDVRARINVLSALSNEWSQLCREWTGMNAALKSQVNDKTTPSAQAELLLYQSLVGIWPLESGDGVLEEIASRLADYMVKAAREAKLETSWADSDEQYESGLREFVAELVTGSGGEKFRASFGSFAERVALHGVVNSLGQVLLKAGMPGVPDIYQGNESWDFSLVDPDNRRLVDFSSLNKRLAGMTGDMKPPQEVVADLAARWQTGEIKQWVTAKALYARAQHAELFASGSYVPLETKGPRNQNCCAFVRSNSGQQAIIAVTRLSNQLGDSFSQLIGEDAWPGSSLSIPAAENAAWTDQLTGNAIRSVNGSLSPAEIFKTLPVALLISN